MPASRLKWTMLATNNAACTAGRVAAPCSASYTVPQNNIDVGSVASSRSTSTDQLPPHTASAFDHRGEQDSARHRRDEFTEQSPSFGRRRLLRRNRSRRLGKLWRQYKTLSAAELISARLPRSFLKVKCFRLQCGLAMKNHDHIRLLSTGSG